MKAQKEFLASLLAAPQDISLSVLQDLLNQGYNETRWNTSPGAKDAPCIVKNGDKMALEEFISGLQHSAPIYEKTHVGCLCSVTVTGPDLPDVEVSAFGQIGTTPIAEPTPTPEPEEEKEEEKEKVEPPVPKEETKPEEPSTEEKPPA